MNDLLKDLEHLITELDDPNFSDADFRRHASNFITLHHLEIRKNCEVAAKWNLANVKRDIGDGERIDCHVNVGVNVWENDDWVSFHVCSIDELEQVLNKIDSGDAQDEN